MHGTIVINECFQLPLEEDGGLAVFNLDEIPQLQMASSKVDRPRWSLWQPIYGRLRLDGDERA
jgi:hypothetical protein